MIDQPGIYEIPAEQYHADPVVLPSLSSSIAKLICQCSPSHARLAHPRLNPQVEEENGQHFDIGTIAHAIILQGEHVAAVIDAGDWRTKVAKEQRDAARAAGRIPILAHQFEEVQLMVAAARAQIPTKEAKDAFTNGKPEQTLVWQESEGLWCRARLDWLHDDYHAIDDYKTTSISANPELISRRLFENGWDIQCAFYLRGLMAVTGREAQFRFIVQETFAPHAVCVIGLGPDSMMIGEKKVMFAIDTFDRCLKRDRWPGYPRRTCYATLPKWEEEKWLQKELA